MNDPALRRWAAAGLLGLVAILVAIPLSRMREASRVKSLSLETRQKPST